MLRDMIIGEQPHASSAGATSLPVLAESNPFIHNHFWLRVNFPVLAPGTPYCAPSIIFHRVRPGRRQAPSRRLAPEAPDEPRRGSYWTVVRARCGGWATVRGLGCGWIGGGATGAGLASMMLWLMLWCTCALFR
jgi:hypothetical protein